MKEKEEFLMRLLLALIMVALILLLFKSLGAW